MRLWQVAVLASLIAVTAMGCGGVESKSAETAPASAAATTENEPSAAERAAKVKREAKARAQRLKALAERKAAEAVAEARQKAAEARAKLEAARKLAVKRQRELVGYGYELVVDGDWGPRSQEAWADLLARKKPAYSASWETSMISLVSELTNASETLGRIIDSLAFGQSYSKSELEGVQATLASCEASVGSYRPPLQGYDSTLQLMAQGCAAYTSAVEQLPAALKGDGYVRFTGVESALRQGDARFRTLSYDLDGVADTDVYSAPPSAAPEDEYVPDYGGDLDCADFNGEVDVSGGDPHGLDGDGDGVGCEQ